MTERRDTPSPSALVRTTPVPNWVFDEALPQLGDTELRVLLVVVRSTWGWQDQGGRRQRDWLSHRQLQARTGRSSAVVSRAIAALVKRELVEVTDAAGQPLASARQRSQARGRLFYQVRNPPMLVGWVRTISGNEARDEKAGGQGKRRSCDTPPSPNSEFLVLQSPLETVATNDTETKTKGVAAYPREVVLAQDTRKSRPPKVRPTKENGDKENSEKSIMLPIPASVNEVTQANVEGLECAEDDERQMMPPAMPERKEADTQRRGDVFESPVGREPEVGEETPSSISPEVEKFLQVFEQTYQRARPGLIMPVMQRENYALLQRRLNQHSVEELELWLPEFFECSFGYVKRRSWSLESYLNTLTILQAAKSRIVTK